MNPKKQKVKVRRRARKLAEQAWEAVDAGNLDLAEKIVRRAVAAQMDNPVLWVDQGLILGLRRKEAESADAFRAAISLAPTFAEPYAHLAALRIRQGFSAEAVALQAQAVKHAPDDAGHAERLAAYQALADSERPPALSPPLPLWERGSGGEGKGQPSPPSPLPQSREKGEEPDRLSSYDWDRLAERLTRDGCVLIERLLDATSCQHLCNLFDQDELFAKTVDMDRPEFGHGLYRYFRVPVPAVVERVRSAVYRHAARIANGWQELLGETERFPPEWDAFREQCRQAGQTVSTPILLRYGPGGFNALHRDLRGSVFFPIQLAIVLSRRADSDAEPGGFTGGEFLFCDVPERRKSRRRAIVAGLGDAVLFCTRDRLVRVGDTYGLQPVKHGAARVTAGTRFVLGVPFHQYR
jgi:hypothetical protein